VSAGWPFLNRQWDEQRTWGLKKKRAKTWRLTRTPLKLNRRSPLDVDTARRTSDTSDITHVGWTH
jgi:hypothetical protein